MQLRFHATLRDKKRERSRCPVLLCHVPERLLPGRPAPAPGIAPSAAVSLRSWWRPHGNFPECRHNAILLPESFSGTLPCRCLPLRRLPSGPVGAPLGRVLSRVDLPANWKGVCHGGRRLVKTAGRPRGRYPGSRAAHLQETQESKGGGCGQFLGPLGRWSLYSHRARMRAVRLYIRYRRAALATIRELGYPGGTMLRAWYREFVESGDLHQGYRAGKYSDEQKQRAVEHFCRHGRSISKTIALLGYPKPDALRKWIDELRPGTRKVYAKRGPRVSFSEEQKRRAVIDLCSGECSAAAITRQLGVSRYRPVCVEERVARRRGGCSHGQEGSPSDE